MPLPCYDDWGEKLDSSGGAILMKIGCTTTSEVLREIFFRVAILFFKT
jgi:hypothetical protein